METPGKGLILIKDTAIFVGIVMSLKRFLYDSGCFSYHILCFVTAVISMK